MSSKDQELRNHIWKLDMFLENSVNISLSKVKCYLYKYFYVNIEASC